MASAFYFHVPTHDAFIARHAPPPPPDRARRGPRVVAAWTKAARRVFTALVWREAHMAASFGPPTYVTHPLRRWVSQRDPAVTAAFFETLDPGRLAQEAVVRLRAGRRSSAAASTP